jgi:hypothetical protein
MLAGKSERFAGSSACRSCFSTANTIKSFHAISAAKLSAVEIGDTDVKNV